MKSIALFNPGSVQVCSKCNRASTHSTGECPKCGSAMLSPSPVPSTVEYLKNGDRVADHYTVLRRLGEGAFAEVYLVQEDDEDKPRVLKRPRVWVSPDDRCLKLFVCESELWISLGTSHNIVTAYDVQVISGLPYLLMEYVDGSSLDDRLLPTGMDLRDSVRTAMGIANGLSFAWRNHQVTHGDLHPGNVLITRDGTVKITDFGLAYSYLHLYYFAEAYLKDSGIPKPQISANSRNPCFLSPEQLSDLFLVDTRSDIYAFGMLLYRMVTGQFPFATVAGNDANAIRQWHMSGSVTSPDYLCKEIPPELARLILRCLNKTPEERYQDFESVWKELKQCSDQHGFTSPYEKYVDNARQSIDEMNLELSRVLLSRQEKEGLALQQLERHREAIEKFNQSLESKPKEFSTWWNKGNSHFALGEIEQALRSFEQASQIRPNDLDVMLRIGHCRQKLGYFEAAVKSFDSFIQHAPREHEELYYAYFRRGQIHTLFERYEQAESDYCMALHLLRMDDQIEPETPITDIAGLCSILDLFQKTSKEHDVLAWFLYNRGLRSFMNYLDHCIQSDPENAHFVRWKGSAYRLIGEDEKALRYLQQAHKLVPTDTDTTLELAELLTGLEQFQEADSLISEVLRQEPGNSLAQLMKVRLLAEQGDQKSALAILEQMVVEQPGDPSLLNNLGCLLMEMNDDLDRADKCFANAADLDPRSNTAIHNRIKLYKRKDHDFDLILKLCDLCLERDPYDLQALLDKAMIYGMRGNLKEAEQYVAEARRLDPDNETAAKLMEEFNEFTKKIRRLKL